MSHIEHKQQSPRSVRCYVVTVSDTRTNQTDTAGRAIGDLLQAAGHEVAGRTILPSVSAAAAPPDVAVILVPAARILPALEDCGRAGVRGVAYRQALFVVGVGGALRYVRCGA